MPLAIEPHTAETSNEVLPESTATTATILPQVRSNHRRGLIPLISMTKNARHHANHTFSGEQTKTWMLPLSLISANNAASTPGWGGSISSACVAV